ncbi:tannase/feruloyl esterase family alpha/beta hydrolase [Streptomyces sp. NBC_01207]|uniref:tannase/feruloyl esterase family alpha/beta hydrolase n=1 Tax=Streptomyces sp. NBC_01207 TaxID=2903772 RepID=UPI002E10D31A|nr:tannase/feruloyl esterase family alpha/beta hydrolase [Streptomyces sp. NBC_01207]
MRFVRPVAAVAAALLAATLASTSTGASASTSTNVNANATPEASKCTVRVPGAEHLIGACLADLTTAGTIASGHTDKNDWLGLEAPGAVAPSGVKGIQLDGYFPDSSTTNTNHGWNHDSQFVIRLPDHWNGGLVVAGPPGLREQYANDRLISDHVLAKGYAYAATDKGNTGERIYTDGKRPGDAVAEWNDRVTELTVAARRTVARHYGRMPANTFMAGASAGGYLVRWQLENHPELYTGGVELHGLLLTPDSPNVLDTAPAALRAYPRAALGDPAALEEMYAAGYPAETRPMWEWHYRNLWDPLQRIMREEIDPGYDGGREAGIPFCAAGTQKGCDADYVYADRPDRVRRTVERLSLTGRIERPLITVQGTLDALLPISRSGDVYAKMVEASGRGDLHRYYRITGGTHADGLVQPFPDLVRPMSPCLRSAFDALTAWTGHGVAPPASRTVPAAEPGTDTVNTCSL